MKKPRIAGFFHGHSGRLEGVRPKPITWLRKQEPKRQQRAQQQEPKRQQPVPERQPERAQEPVLLLLFCRRRPEQQQRSG